MLIGTDDAGATPAVAVTITVPATGTEVEPGATASWQVRVRNLRATSAVYVVDVLGEPAEWCRVTPRVLDIPAGAIASTVAEFHVPRASRPCAGTITFSVRATSVSPPGGEADATGALEVAPFAEMRASLLPPATVGASSEYFLVMENRGNQPLHASVSATPSDDRDVIRIDACVLRAAAGARAQTTVRVCQRQRWRWGLRRRRFTVVVAADHTPPVQLEGVITRPGGFPPWAANVVAIVAMALFGGLWRSEVADWFASEPSAEQVLDDAGPTAAGEGSSRLLLSLEVGDPSSGPGGYRMEGALDYRHDRGWLDVDLAASGVPGVEGTMRVLRSGPALLVEVPPGLGRPADKPWLRLEVPDLADGAALSEVDEGLALGILAAVTGLGSAAEVLRGEVFELALETREAGTEVVRGDTTTRYRLLLDQAAMTASLLPEAEGSFTSASADVWVDQRGRLRRIRQEMTVVAAAKEVGSSISETVVFTMEVFDFGVPVEFEEPHSAQTAALSELVASER